MRHGRPVTLTLDGVRRRVWTTAGTVDGALRRLGVRAEGARGCESGGRPGAVDASGTYGGPYRFGMQTWHALGGRGRLQDAPASEQTFRAKKLYVQRGASPRPHCGRRLTG